MGDLSKLTWSRDVTGKVDNIHSNLTPKTGIRCIASSLKFLWYGSMEWNMEKNFSMEWKIFGMEWKKITSIMEYGKSSSIPFHTMP